MSDTIIKVENISKRYRLGMKEERAESLFGAFTSFLKSPVSRFKKLKSLTSFDQENADDILWALKDVSFEVKRGEVLGIIGKNGAGKSTLLKVLAQITEPSSGRIDMYGRVASLLEVGTGFHNELTGRENVYLNGTILGMTKKEIDRKFDEIVEFSGISKFIDTPVKRYSSGMKVRLAFSVAAHLDPEILLIDEVLAVGDAEFQKKCLGKMDDVAKSGRTVLFVSHQMSAVQKLCTRCLLLNNGKFSFLGESNNAIGNYLASDTDNEFDYKLIDNDFITINKIELRSASNTNIQIVLSGQVLKFFCEIFVKKKVVNPVIRLKVVDSFDNLKFICNSGHSSLNISSVESSHIFICEIEKFPLLGGRYYIDFDFFGNNELIYSKGKIIGINVQDGDFYGTGKVPAIKEGVLVPHTWSQS